ncbi:MAG: DUF4065 domain-containing protein [Tannerella sp.]|jgi:uncharacterized phage-associated protein|nr:DUF4065 domain-containing protein [Tannerella sp.]
MYNVNEIANKILYVSSLPDTGEYISNMKLQKLLYYQQGFHLAYFDTPLFDDEIEAWMYGPVVPSVYERFEKFGKNGINNDNTNKIPILTDEEESLFNEVMETYGKYSAIGLMNLTHSEKPWKNTDIGVGNIIAKNKMKSFFRNRLK